MAREPWLVCLKVSAALEESTKLRCSCLFKALSTHSTVQTAPQLTHPAGCPQSWKPEPAAQNEGRRRLGASWMHLAHTISSSRR